MRTLQVCDLLRREAAAGEAHGVAARAPLQPLHIKADKALHCGREG